MRTVSDSVLKRLRSYDPEVDVRWDQSRARFMLYWRERRICALEHLDGTPMLADVVVEEAMEILQRADNHKDGPERLVEIERNLKLHHERVDLHQQRLQAEAQAIGSEAWDVAANGLKPFVHIRNNPLASKELAS